MPKIPTYERRGQLPVSYQSGLDSRERAAFTLGSQGTAETGKDIREAASIAYKWNEQQKKEKASLDMALVSSEMGERFSIDFENITNQEERNIGKYRNKDLTQRYDGTGVQEGQLLVDLTREAVDKLINSKDYATIAEGNKYFAAEFEKFSLRFREVAMSKAIQQQSQFHIQAVELGIQDGLEKAATHVSNSPTQLDGTMMMWRTVLGDMAADKIPESMKGLAAIGVKPEGADKYLAIARPATVQKAKENLNKIAEVAFLRMIADDPKTAHAALKQLGETPEGKWKLEKLYGFTGDQYLRLLNSSKTSSEFVNVAAKYNLERELDDAVAAALTGTTPAGFNSVETIQAKVYSVLDPNDPKSKEQAYVIASKAFRDISVNRRIYSTTASFASMSTADIIKTVQNLKPSGKDAADETRIQQGVQQQANVIIQQRQQDAAAHYKGNSVVNNYIMNGERGKANDHIIAAQRRDGVPDQDIVLLTKTEVEVEKSYLTGTRGEQLGQRLRSFIERYGGKNGERRGDLQIAWRQLTTGPNPLPPEYIWAANAMGTAAEPSIIAALGTSQDVVKQNLGKLSDRGVSYTFIENVALNVGQKYKTALTGNIPDRLTTYNSAQALAIRIAASKLAVSGANNVQREVEDAFKLITQGYDLQGGTYFVQTKSLGGGSTALNPKVIHENAQRIRQDKDLLTKLDTVLAPGSMNPGNKDPVRRQKEFLEMLEKRSFWINNANNTGLQLVIDAGGGIVEPVTNNQGNPYELTWQQLGNVNLVPKKRSNWFGIEFK